ncbi:SWIM zinc finger family protein [Thermus antranikianii]|uniref:SWIM zinc finger family protein n=1 Tax=Thermus antranikianii TaxID=88190 RepID=UPI001C78FF8F|nr:SWIM zinc finger family protein [Thermus antranikianii]QWK22543.1 MAG: SWIM zinc finger family protein [Thermus antranikianii]
MPPFPPREERDFASLVPQEVLRRGLAYYQEGRVLRVFRVGEKVLGLVQGSAEAPYRVEVGPGLWGRCSCPYPEFPCKHAVALLYAYVEEKAPDLAPLIEALTPEEARGLLKKLALLPEVGLYLAEALAPEKAFLEGVKDLRRAFRLGGGQEEARALSLRLDRVGRKEVEAYLEALLEAPFDPEPYLRIALERYLALTPRLSFLLNLYLRHPSEALREAFLQVAGERGEEALHLLRGGNGLGLKRALRAELLFRLGRVEEGLSALREGLEGVEDYLLLVERLMALGRVEEALRYAEEARDWFGKDPRLLPLLDLLVAHRGNPEDHRARFGVRPNLEDYLALKSKLGREFYRERKALLRQVRDPALLARIYLLEEDWKALDRLLRNTPPEAYPALAEVLEEKLPEEAKRLYLEAARREVEKGTRKAYREAARLLGRLSRLDPKAAREAALALLQAYPRRRALKEELGFWLSEKPHGPMTE